MTTKSEGAAWGALDDLRRLKLISEGRLPTLGNVHDGLPK
jgi:hypothetical protein